MICGSTDAHIALSVGASARLLYPRHREPVTVKANKRFSIREISKTFCSDLAAS